MEATPPYTIRQMRREEISAALDLWRETNLSEGTHTLYTWYDHDPRGFHVAVDDSGAVIGCLAGIVQNEKLAFLGLFVVKPGHRGRGIGRSIWDHVMEGLGAGRNVGVNPVPDQLENYRDRAGFHFQSSWSNVVCSWKEVDVTRMTSECCGVHIRPVTPDDIAEVADYDEHVLGFPRKKLVKLSFQERESVMMVGFHGDRVCGYGIIKMNIKGNALVGPLYADDARVAEALLCHLVRAFPVAQSRGLTLMSIDCNRGAMGMTERLGFEHEPGLSRLYTREEVIVKFEKVFAQHNLNFSVF